MISAPSPRPGAALGRIWGLLFTPLHLLSPGMCAWSLCTKGGQQFLQGHSGQAQGPGKRLAASGHAGSGSQATPHPLFARGLGSIPTCREALEGFGEQDII